jgi:spermidine synthase
MFPVLLALLSGVPALVYEVVWTREVALIVGGQVEAIAGVVAAFFGGLALGSRLLGPAADRARSPLRLYALLEASAAALAILSPALLRRLGEGALAELGSARLPLAAAVLLPAAFLLGGTLPALIRAATRDRRRAPRLGGWIVGANTLGGLGGVVLAVTLIPLSGLRATLTWAGLGALALAALALAASGPRGSPPLRDAARPRAAPPRVALLAAAAAGTATLAYEVLAARAAALRLGSSLYAWGLVLGLFLAGLAAGNLALAGRAGRTRSVARDLGWIEATVALALALTARWAVPSPAVPALGVTPLGALEIAAAILPAALLMGGAFPLFVRLGLEAGRGPGEVLGSVGAANTAGGILGALLVPFLLLPALGPAGGIRACAALSALLAVALLLVGAEGRRARAPLAVAAALALVLALPPSRSLTPGRNVIFLSHGRQASAAVVHLGSRRDLIVDGESEASTAGNARRTEELLAALPLLLHPEPRRFLEVGLGSGITLAAAARFPLERVECVEISGAVVEAARFFAPDNGGIAESGDARVRIARGDGRAWLERPPERYDVIVANTVHPWSLGATGLYSREYFARIARALRPGGLAAQWLPVEKLGAESLAAILRTFFTVFPEGGIWWGAESLIAVGSTAPLADPAPQLETYSASVSALLTGVGLRSAADIRARRVARAASARRVLGPGAVLSDDRPLLEAGGTRWRAAARGGGELELVERLARAEAARDPSVGPLLLWIESRVARAAGQDDRADRIERLAEEAGLTLARDDRVGRSVERAYAHANAGRWREAEAGFRRALAERPDGRDPRYGLAFVLLQRGDATASARELEELLASRGADAEAWNLLALARDRVRDRAGAREALERALEADPFLPAALANAGLLAAHAGEDATARAMLRRLRAQSPLGRTPEERALAAALEETR